MHQTKSKQIIVQRKLEQSDDDSDDNALLSYNCTLCTDDNKNTIRLITENVYEHNLHKNSAMF